MLRFELAQFDLVRPGIALYGYPPGYATYYYSDPMTLTVPPQATAPPPGPRPRSLRLRFPTTTAHLSVSQRAAVLRKAMYPADRPDRPRTPYPRPEVRPADFRPALSLHSCVVFLQMADAGDTVGYASNYILPRDTRIATVPIGYADGYMRALGGRADVLIRGCRARVLGRVCMDQIMVDVTDIPDVQIGDDVVLIGKQKSEKITAQDLAERAGTNEYEILTSISARVPRIYLRASDPVPQFDMHAYLPTPKTTSGPKVPKKPVPPRRPAHTTTAPSSASDASSAPPRQPAPAASSPAPPAPTRAK